MWDFYCTCNVDQETINCGLAHGGVVFSVCKLERVAGSLQQDPIALVPAATKSQWRGVLLDPLKLGPAPSKTQDFIFFLFHTVKKK
jgi:hypothetical protein